MSVLAVGNRDSHIVSVLWGNGDGTFQSALKLNEGGGFAGDGVPLAAFTPNPAAVDLWTWDSAPPRRSALFPTWFLFPRAHDPTSSLDRPLMSILPSAPMGPLPALVEELFAELILSLGSFG